MNLRLIANEENQDRAECRQNEAGGMISLDTRLSEIYFEKMSKGVTYSAGGPAAYLGTADGLITEAIRKLDESEQK